MARRTVRVLRGLGAVLAGLVLVIGSAVFLFTATDWGRERVRGFALEQLAGQVAGRVAIERIDGDLLSGAVLQNVSIEDSAGATFLRADTLSLHYSLRSFLSRALIFRDVRLVSPVLVLEQAADGEWNFARLFPQDTSAAAAPSGGGAGFGSVVRLENVVLEDATVVVRSAWTAPDSVSRGDVEAFIARQTGWVVRSGEDWRRLAMVRDLDAELPLVRLADPDSAARVFEVASASMTAYPLRPPGVAVRDLRGRVAMTEDSVWADGVEIALPSSRVRADAEYALEDGSLEAAVAIESLSLADLAWLHADLPDGGARGELTVTRTMDNLRVAARDLDVVLDSGRIAGTFDVQLGDTMRVGEADLTLERLDTRTIERLSGPGTVPVDGIASGALRLAGTTADLAVDGWAEVQERSGRTSRLRAGGEIRTARDGGIDMDPLVVHLEPLHASLVRQVTPGFAMTGEVRGAATVRGSTRTALDVDADLAHAAAGTGRSRVLADGAVDLADVIRARGLRIRFAPLRMALVEQFSPGLPIDGELEGEAVVDGSPMSVLRARVAVTHEAETGTSRVAGGATWRSGGAFDLDLNMPVLALATVGRFAPSAGLQGDVSGAVRANGTLDRFVYAVDLVTADSGAIASEGTIGMGSALRYDVSADLRRLDLRTLMAQAPETRLTGRITADGRDTDPSAMQATIAADLFDTHLSDASVDTSQVRVRVADGIAHVDRARLRLASATAELEGTFGLVAGIPGELDYRVDVARLGDFARYLPADTGMIPPRPVAQARRVASARADSLNTALATQVQRAATGLPAEPTLAVDSVQPVARDSVAGRIAARGTLNGTVQRFDLRGGLTAEDVVAAGASLRRGTAEYALTDVGSDDADVTLDVAVDSPAIAGFAFDSAGVDVRYRGVRDRGRGTLEVSLFQDPSRDYRVASEFLLELDQREMTFNELVLRFDTVRWTAPHSGAVSWAGSAVTVDSLELESDAGGRITFAGRVDDDASSDVRVSVQALPLGQIAALLQDTLSAAGLLDLDVHMRGTTAAPELEGNVALRGASLGKRELPDLRAGFDYAAALLRTEAELQQEGRPLLSATARLPVNLAFTGVEGPRLVDRPLGIEAHADSLPLEALPSFTPSVSDVRGRLRGDVVVGGTWDAPVLNGGIDLDLASLRIVPAGVWLRDIAGAVVLAGDAITVDSLNATSGGGPIRVTGSIDVERLNAPAFDLRVNAENAVLLDTDQGRIRTDADLVIAGPVDSARIEGEVEVREGVLNIPDVGEGKRVTALDDASVLPIVDSARVDEEILPTPNPFLRNLSLDVALRVARDTWVRNTDANVEIYTPPEADPLRVRYNIGRPGLVLDGVIHADRGEYEFAGRVFNLTTGAVTFLPAGSLDPLLQLSANYEVAQRGREALVIQIHLTGQLSKPRIALESTAEPPLSESDLLSYLAFGRESSSVLGSSDAGLTGGNRGIGALAQQQIAGMALGTIVNDAFSSLERRGGRALDVFRIHPAQLPDELAFAGALDNFLRGTEVEAGKYVTTGVFVAAEGSPSLEAWPGLRVEYATPAGFSWRAVWEPRFLPNRPSFSLDQHARTTRVLGTFLYWSRRF